MISISGPCMSPIFYNLCPLLEQILSSHHLITSLSQEKGHLCIPLPTLLSRNFLLKSFESIIHLFISVTRLKDLLWKAQESYTWSHIFPLKMCILEPISQLTLATDIILGIKNFPILVPYYSKTRLHAAFVLWI
jgi:hypothetical protein